MKGFGKDGSRFKALGGCLEGWLRVWDVGDGPAPSPQGI